MTRTEAISNVEAHLGTLPDERLRALAEIVQSWSRPTVFSTLPPEELARLDQAVDSLDRGEGIALDTVDAELETMLKAQGV